MGKKKTLIVVRMERKYATVWKKRVLSEEEKASIERFSKDMT